MHNELNKLEVWLAGVQHNEIFVWIKESLDLLKNTDLSLRYNFCALGLREALRIYFDAMSPSNEIESCDWYLMDKDEKARITRRDRIKYAAYKNIDPRIIMHGLENSSDKFSKNIDTSIEAIELLCSDYQKLIDKLNKYTHVLGCEDGDVFENAALNIVKKFNMINDNIATICESVSYIIQIRIINGIEVDTKYINGSSGTNNFVIVTHNYNSVEFEVDYDVSLYNPNIKWCAPNINRYKIKGTADGRSLKINKLTWTVIKSELEDTDIQFKY